VTIGRAVARYADRTGYPALFDVLAVRGGQLWVQFIGHAGPEGEPVPAAPPLPGPQWLSARRFRLFEEE
jgi:hypothetical protein